MPVFNFALRFDNKGTLVAVEQLRKVSDEAGKAQHAVEGVGSGAQKASGGLKTLTSNAQGATSNVKALAGQLLALVGAYKAVGSVFSFIKNGMNFSANLESSQIAIGSVIGATNKISTAQGKLLEEAEKFNAAQEISAGLMEQIQVLALESTATFDSLVEGVSGIIAPATKAGIAIEKLPKFAVTAAQAMAAMKIPVQQMRTEIEALLSGNINKAQDILATNLGISGEMVKNWQRQGILVEELEKRLRLFAEAGDRIADSWTGLVSNMEDAYDYLSAKTGKGIFEGMKQSYRELLNVLVNTKGKLGVGEDIENIVNLVKELQDQIGNNLISVTREFIDSLKELNQPENLAELKKTINNVTAAAKTAFDVVKDVAGFISKVGGNALDTWNSLPEPVREWGLIVAILGGKKGIVGLAAALTLADSLVNVGQGFVALAEGKLSLSEFAFANGTELKNLLEERGYSSGISSIFSEESTVPSLSQSHPTSNGPALASTRNPVKGERRASYKLENAIGGFSGNKKGNGESQVENARERILKLREEIDRLNGSATTATTSLAQKIRAIADAGKDAKMSAADISKLQAEYTQAFQANTFQEFNKALLQAQGNTQALRKIEIDDTIKGWEQRFESLGMKAEETQPKLNDLRIALEKKHEYQDLQTAVSFYDDLANLSGNYTASIEKQNELIHLQAEIHRQNRLPPDLVAEWELLQKIEKARDPWSGMSRSVRKFYADATDYAKGFEEVSTQALDGFSSQLSSTLWKGEQDFAAFFDSIGQMLMDMAIKASMAQIIGNGSSGGGGLLGLLGGALGGLFGGNGFASSPGFSVGSNAISSGAFWASAQGNVFSGGNLSDYSNSIVTQPTFFGYDRHFTAFASGAGLMGEAGPEAIVPLAHMSDGSLGFNVKGLHELMRQDREWDTRKHSGGYSEEMRQLIAQASEMRSQQMAAMPTINVTVINQAGAEVETNQRQNSDGSLDLEVMITKAVARDMSRRGGSTNQVMRNEYNLSKRPIGR